VPVKPDSSPRESASSRRRACCRRLADPQRSATTTRWRSRPGSTSRSSRDGRSASTSSNGHALSLKEFIASLPIPVIVGGCASYRRAAPDAHRRGGRARGSGARQAHDARRARRGRAAGDSDRRAAAAGIRHLLGAGRRSTSSPTGAPQRRATSPRGRPSCQVSPAKRRQRPRPRLPTGYGDLPPDASRGARVAVDQNATLEEIVIARRPRTTARST
jgi:hypothetical protein